MGYVVRMPQLGMSMDEGTVVEWRVDEGERVTAGDVIAVIESEKTAADVEAREDGRLERVLVPEGGTVNPGEPIGVVAGPDEAVESILANEPATGDPDDEDVTAATARSDRSDGETVRATPGARRRAEEAGVKLATIEGTGPQGVITEDDVTAAERATASEASTPADRGAQAAATRTVTDARPLTGMQRTIADRLGTSERETVRVTLHRSFDAAPLRRIRERARESGIGVSIEDLLLIAVREALQTHPEFNAIFEDGEHRLVEEINLGVAVDVDGGLVTPVLGDVTGNSVEELASRRRELVERVAAGSFTTDDLADGTFTVSNLGPFGVDHFDPVIDPPQVAILGVGRVRADETVTVSLSFDHRVVNGADAATFLGDIVEAATDPETLTAHFETDVVGAAGRATESRVVRVETDAGLAGQYAVEGVTESVRFDEPVETGGTGTAPTPVEHLLGALGSCLSLSVRLMGHRDEIEVDAITAEVAGSPADGPLEAVEVTLGIATAADDASVDRVVTKAERACYVERVLDPELAVSVTWTRMD